MEGGVYLTDFQGVALMIVSGLFGSLFTLLIMGVGALIEYVELKKKEE